MSEASIMFDFQVAKRQADEIDAIADQLSNLSNKKFENTMQTLSNNWKGTSAESYLSKCTKLQGTMGTTASNMRTVASNIRSVAQKIYDAEMENLRLAQERAAVSKS
ncbi:WXG100 family type VII secretion target [Anaerosporobacter sp.]